MSIKLNRRTFIAVLGTTGVVAAFIRPGIRRPVKSNPLQPAHFLDDQHTVPPARPKSAAITYLAS